MPDRLLDLGELIAAPADAVGGARPSGQPTRARLLDLDVIVGGAAPRRERDLPLDEIVGPPEAAAEPGFLEKAATGLKGVITETGRAQHEAALVRAGATTELARDIEAKGETLAHHMRETVPEEAARAGRELGVPQAGAAVGALAGAAAEMIPLTPKEAGVFVALAVPFGLVSIVGKAGAVALAKQFPKLAAWEKAGFRVFNKKTLRTALEQKPEIAAQLSKETLAEIYPPGSRLEAIVPGGEVPLPVSAEPPKPTGMVAPVPPQALPAPVPPLALPGPLAPTPGPAGPSQFIWHRVPEMPRPTRQALEELYVKEAEEVAARHGIKAIPELPSIRPPGQPAPKVITVKPQVVTTPAVRSAAKGAEPLKPSRPAEPTELLATPKEPRPREIRTPDQQFLDDIPKSVEEEQSIAREVIKEGLEAAKGSSAGLFPGSLQEQLLAVAETGKIRFKPGADFYGELKQIVNQGTLAERTFFKRILRSDGKLGIDEAVTEAAGGMPGGVFRPPKGTEGVVRNLNTPDGYINALRQEIRQGSSVRPGAQTLREIARREHRGFREAESILAGSSDFAGVGEGMSLGAAAAREKLPSALYSDVVPASSVRYRDFLGEKMAKALAEGKDSRYLTLAEREALAASGAKKQDIDQIARLIAEPNAVRNMPPIAVTQLRRKDKLLEEYGFGVVGRPMRWAWRNMERDAQTFSYVLDSAARAAVQPGNAKDVAIRRFLENKRTPEVMELMDQTALSAATDARTAWNTLARMLGLRENESIEYYVTHVLKGAYREEDVPFEFFSMFRSDVLQMKGDKIDLQFLKRRFSDLGEDAFVPGYIEPFSIYAKAALRYIHLKRPMELLNTVLKKVRWQGKENTREFLEQYADSQMQLPSWSDKHILGPTAKSLAGFGQDLVPALQKLGLGVEDAAMLRHRLTTFMELPSATAGRRALANTRAEVYRSTVGWNVRVLAEQLAEVSKVFAEFPAVDGVTGFVQFGKVIRHMARPGSAGEEGMLLAREIEASGVMSPDIYRRLLHLDEGVQIKATKSIFGDKWMAAFQGADYLGRVPAYLAARSWTMRRMARAARLGIKYEGPTPSEAGLEAAGDLFFEFTPAVTPLIFEGSIRKTLFTLGSWQFRQMEYMRPITSVKKLINPTKWIVKDPLSWGNWAFDQDLKRWAKLQGLIYTGIGLGAAMGVDVSSRFQSMVPAMYNPNTEEWEWGWLRVLPLGPYPSAYVTAKEALSHFTRHEWKRGLTELGRVPWAFVRGGIPARQAWRIGTAEDKGAAGLKTLGIERIQRSKYPVRVH